MRKRYTVSETEIKRRNQRILDALDVFDVPDAIYPLVKSVCNRVYTEGMIAGFDRSEELSSERGGGQIITMLIAAIAGCIVGILLGGL